MSKYSFFIFLLVVLSSSVLSQTADLEYIFREPPVINPRPSIKAVNSKYNKLYYYADPDYNQTLELYEYNYASGTAIQVSDSTKSYSEFVLMENGDLLTILDGDIYISKDFAATNEFTKDVRFTSTDEYEYGLNLHDNVLIFRRAGNYFMKLINNPVIPELQLTKDESDSISYQLIGISDYDSLKNNIRMLFARYDNSGKRQLLVPDYNDKFVRFDRLMRGVGGVRYIEYNVKLNSSGNFTADTSRIIFPGNARYTVSNTDYSFGNSSVLFDVESTDRQTRSILSYDLAKHEFSELYKEHYENGWFERHGTPTVFISADEFLFESEISGYNNIYKMQMGSPSAVPLIAGKFTVVDPVIDRMHKKIYAVVNPDEPGTWYIYESDFKGSYFRRLTKEGTGYDMNMQISPDGSMLFYSFSKTTVPHELYSVNITSGEEKQVTNTISPEYNAYSWITPELITYPNYEDGEIIYAHLYKPRDFDSRKKYPLICFVHGSGYLQNVTKGFAWYQDNFMVNTYFADRGYLILDVDFRGSMGYGVEFRNKTWHNLGYWEVSDYISGIKYLESQNLIDREKVGIYGGSYGGFITLMAVFQHPEFFKCGIALRAVSDWTNYYYVNPWFVYGRLGDDLEVNRSIYETASPLSYAQNLQVPLLIMHGVLDDNVFFQQTVHLVEKLIENKKQFEVMFYPREYHSFRLQTSWLDEYKRIDKFFENKLKN